MKTCFHVVLLLLSTYFYFYAHIHSYTHIHTHVLYFYLIAFTFSDFFGFLAVWWISQENCIYIYLCVYFMGTNECIHKNVRLFSGWQEREEGSGTSKIFQTFFSWKCSQSIKCIYFCFIFYLHTTTTYHLFCSTIIITMIIRATTVLLLLVLILCYTHGDKIITIMIL